MVRLAEWKPLMRQLMLERHHALLGYARLLTGSPPDAEDLLQDALIETFARNRVFPNAIAAEAYVRRTMATRFLDRRRSTTRERAALVRLGGAGERFDGPESAVLDRTAVGAALLKLSPRERACVMLRYFDDLSVGESARVLGVSDGAVKRYVSDGIGKLNRLLGTEASADDAAWVTVRAEKEARNA